MKNKNGIEIDCQNCEAFDKSNMPTQSTDAADVSKNGEKSTESEER